MIHHPQFLRMFQSGSGGGRYLIGHIHILWVGLIRFFNYREYVCLWQLENKIKQLEIEASAICLSPLGTSQPLGDCFHPINSSETWPPKRITQPLESGIRKVNERWNKAHVSEVVNIFDGVNVTRAFNLNSDQLQKHLLMPKNKGPQRHRNLNKISVGI